MKIGLHDSDHTGFPNLALMKISAYHKAKGDEVRWWIPLEQYDKVYSSKIFTFTPEEPMLPPETVKGGTGYGVYDSLPEEIDSVFPDYSIYPNCDYAIGFLTRGCIRKCPWCIVPKKEGEIRPYCSWENIKRPDSRNIVFMDNNVLASDWGLQQLESMIGKNVRIDFNQGLDARLITDDVARIISELKWIEYIRMACDTDEMLPVVQDTLKRLKEHGVKPYRVFVYLLVQDVKSAEKRALALRMAGAKVFAQPYRDFDNKIEPTKEQRDFARFVNRREIFYSADKFTDYKNTKRK